MKHIAAYQKIIQNNTTGLVLILEDDAVFSKNFKGIFFNLDSTFEK